MGAIRASINQALLDGETKNAQARRTWKGKEKMNNEFKPKKSLIQHMKPRALRRLNIRGLTRESTPTIRKETIQRNIV